MGTKEADAGVKIKENLSFDGSTSKWEDFKKTLKEWAAITTVDKVCLDWVLNFGSIYAAFLAIKTKDKATERASRKAKPVQTDPAKYDQGELQQHFDTYKAGVTLKMLLTKVKKEELGNNFTDAAALGFTDDELQDFHLNISVRHLQRVNRTVVSALYNSVFKNSPEDASSRVKLHSILESQIVTEILSDFQKVDQETQSNLESWVTKPWLIPAVYIWGQIMHRYQGMTEMIQGTLVQEMADLINNVGEEVPPEKRLTIYKSDEAFAKIGETMVNHFQDTKTMWAFLRASLRQFHIHKLAKVGKNKEAWKKADEFLTELLESDTLLTLEHTNEAIKRAEGYMQRELRDKNTSADVKFVRLEDAEETSAAFQVVKARDDENEGLKARVAALEAQLSSGQDNAGGGGKKRKKQAAKQTASKDKPKCAECGKLGHEAAECWTRAERILKEKEEKLKKQNPRRQPTKEEVAAFHAGFAANKNTEEYVPVPTVEEVAEPLGPLPKYGGQLTEAIVREAFGPFHAIAHHGQVAVDIKGCETAIVDSGAQVAVTTSRNKSNNGQLVRLHGVSGDIEATREDTIFPLTTSTGKVYSLLVRNHALVVQGDSRPPLLSLAVLMKAGFKPEFKAGTPMDAQDGGHLTTPSGEIINMRFEDNLWRIPMWGKAKAVNSQEQVLMCAVKTYNVFDALQSPDLPSEEAVQMAHDIACHPSNAQLAHNCKVRHGKSFPQGFTRALASFKCVTCAVCKGARKYRRSKQAKRRARKEAERKRNSMSLQDVADLDELTDPKKLGLAVDDAAAKEALAQVSKLVDAEKNNKQQHTEPVKEPELPYRMHIDYAHSISMGYNKEKYFLVMVLDGIDFTYASPTTRRTEPEALLREFLTLTGIKIRQIRLDGAAEFGRSATFRAYCANQGINIEEVPAYTHTLNARAEGAVRIIKEHVRCLLRTANLPRRFWPYAVRHFTRMYAWWPDKSGKCAWDKLDALGPHSLVHDYDRDHHRFGSYVTGHLPREHPGRPRSRRSLAGE